MKSPSCSHTNISKIALEFNVSVLKSLNVTQPNPKTLHPRRKCVCAPLPSLGVCGKQKEEHIPLGTLHKTRCYITLTELNFYLLWCSDLVRATEVSQVKNEHGALNQMHQTSFKSDRSGSSRPWGNESFVLSPDTRMEQSFCRWKRTCATRKQRRTSPTFLTTIWSHLRLTSWNEDLLDIIIVVIVSEDS